ncbi:hypothetical protein NL464_27000, partial [Klebsiella pneumoniae]|nr:hypothetical protein [Klebsiella pneumoniae]
KQQTQKEYNSNTIYKKEETNKKQYVMKGTNRNGIKIKKHKKKHKHKPPPAKTTKKPKTNTTK